jgi:hypothetical protein
VRELKAINFPGGYTKRDSANRFMKEMPLYPLRFEPIYQYRPWGGRRLSTLLSAPLPGDGPIGEAWLLSDRDEHPSVVADGPLEATCPDTSAGSLCS